MKDVLGLLPAALHRLAYRSAYQLLRAWWWLRQPSASGAAVACWYDDRLLVLRTSYRDLLHLPCGGLRRGEDTRAAALREFHEEVAIEVPPAVLSGPDRLEFVDEGRSIVDWVFEWHPTHRPEPRVDHREIVWAGWLTPGELTSLPLTPTLRLYLARCASAPSGGVSPHAGRRIKFALTDCDISACAQARVDHRAAETASGLS